MLIFKPYAKVRVLDGSKIPKYVGGWCRDMVKEVGTIQTIRSAEMFPDGRVAYKLVESDWLYDSRGLQLMEEAK